VTDFSAGVTDFSAGSAAAKTPEAFDLLSVVTRNNAAKGESTLEKSGATPPLSRIFSHRRG